MDEAPRPALDEWQDGRDGGVGRRAECERLDERDAKREARLGVIGEPPAGGAID